MRYWLGVAHRDHVRRGVDQGIAQLNHGARAPIARLSPGDGLLYYSPKDVTASAEGATGKPLQAFTAIGRVAEGKPWQAAPVAMLGKDVSPWRRRVEYVDGVAEVPIGPLLPVLELTRDTPNWGWVMRRGTLEVSAHDFRIIAGEMGAASLVE